MDLNPAAERAFGRPRETAVGRVLADLLIPPALRERHRLGLQRYLETGEARVLGRRVEMPALRADGTEFPAEATVAAVPGGPRPIFIGTLRDVTEARRARDRHRIDRPAGERPEAAAALIDARPGRTGRAPDRRGWSHAQSSARSLRSATWRAGVRAAKRRTRSPPRALCS